MTKNRQFFNATAVTENVVFFDQTTCGPAKLSRGKAGRYLRSFLSTRRTVRRTVGRADRVTTARIALARVASGGKNFSVYTHKPTHGAIKVNRRARCRTTVRFNGDREAKRALFRGFGVRTKRGRNAHGARRRGGGGLCAFQSADGARGPGRPQVVRRARATTRNKAPRTRFVQRCVERPSLPGSAARSPGPCCAVQSRSSPRV